MRRTLLPLSLIVVALAGFAAWTLAVRHDSAAARDTRVASAVAAAVGTVPPHDDIATETWSLSLPPVAAPAPQCAVRPAAEPAPAQATDWAALSAGVATAASPTTASLAVATPAPAELAIDMSARERRALIASAREPESPPGPRGYRPGIAVIVPGGSVSDGVCR